MLSSAYNDTGVGSISSQANQWKSLAYDECKNLEEYLNKLRSTQTNLSTHDITIPDEIWSSR